MSKSKFEKLEGQVIYDLSSKRGLTSNPIITKVNNNFNPNVKESEEMNWEAEFKDIFFEAVEEGKFIKEKLMEEIKEMLKTVINLAVNNSKERKNDKGDDEMGIENEKVDNY